MVAGGIDPLTICSILFHPQDLSDAETAAREPVMANPPKTR
jgi:hypothetical protein